MREIHDLAETEIKSMKEGRSSDSIEYISDESGDDVEEHGDQDKLSNFNEPESDPSHKGFSGLSFFNFKILLGISSVSFFSLIDSKFS
jgi:hypothetical protein